MKFSELLKEYIELMQEVPTYDPNRFLRISQVLGAMDKLVGYDYNRQSHEVPSMQPPPMVPPGWRLVPIDPTQEMLRAAANCYVNTSMDGSALDYDKLRHGATYRAMVLAAPEEPQ